MWRELGRAIRTWCAACIYGMSYLLANRHLDFGATVVFYGEEPFGGWRAPYYCATTPCMN